ncbi:MAG: MmcQ/YjbR family DNA-binding protein [Candidatus Binatia bacterium]
MAPRAPLARVRAICLALPDGVEKEAWGSPTFRVGGGKMFAMFVDDHHGDGRVAIWCKAEPGVQEIVVGAAPQRFFVPPYVGHNGWIGLRLDQPSTDWDEVAEFLADAHRLCAPKRLLKAMEAGAAPARQPAAKPQKATRASKR